MNGQADVDPIVRYLREHQVQLVIMTKDAIVPVKLIEADCFSAGRPWVVVLEADESVSNDWEP